MGLKKLVANIGFKLLGKNAIGHACGSVSKVAHRKAEKEKHRQENE